MTTSMTPNEGAPSTDDAAALYDVAADLYDRDDFRRAADLFRCVALTSPTSAHAWWGLAACHERMDDAPVAATLYETGYRLGGEELPELALLCARAHLASGNLEGAQQMLDELSETTLPSHMAEHRRQLVCELQRGVR